MKIRHLIRLIILLFILLLMLIRVIPDQSNQSKQAGFYQINQIQDLYVVSIIQGSGEFIAAQIIDKSSYTGLSNALHKSVFPALATLGDNDLVYKTTGQRLPSYPEGNLLIGNYDADPAIEIATFHNEFWREIEDFTIIEVDSSNRISIETQTSTIITMQIHTVLSSVYLLMLMSLLFWLIVLSWGVEYIVVLLSKLSGK